MDGFVRGARGQGRARPRNAARKRIEAAAARHGGAPLPARRSRGRDGLPRRARDPQLLGVRQPVRPAGPHVRAELRLEPARAPLPGLRVVGEVRAPERPDDVQERPLRSSGGPGARRASATRTGRSTPGPTSRTCSTATTSAGATTSCTGREPDCDDGATLKCDPGPLSIGTPEHLEPVARVHHGRGRTISSRNIQPVTDFIAAARTGSLPAVSWVVPDVPSQRAPGLIDRARSGLGHGPRERGHERPGLEEHRDLPRLGRLGRLLRPRPTSAGRPKRLRPARPRARHQPVREARLRRSPGPLLRRLPRSSSRTTSSEGRASIPRPTGVPIRAHGP